MSRNTATAVLHIIGITLTAISLAVSLFLLAWALLRGPSGSPPGLQIALCSLVFPGVFAYFTASAGWLGRVVGRE